MQFRITKKLAAKRGQPCELCIRLSVTGRQAPPLSAIFFCAPTIASFRAAT